MNFLAFMGVCSVQVCQVTCLGEYKSTTCMVSQRDVPECLLICPKVTKIGKVAILNSVFIQCSTNLNALRKDYSKLDAGARSHAVALLAWIVRDKIILM